MFRRSAWGVLVLLVGAWLGGCPAPILLPPLACEGQQCDEPSTDRSDGIASDGERIAEAVLPESLSEGDAAPRDEPVTNDKPSEPMLSESRPDGEVSREVTIERKPELVSRDTRPRCIDEDGDGRCRNKIHSTYRIDCDDTDRRVFPGQAGFFTTPRKSGGWDFNCNGRVEKQFKVYTCQTVIKTCQIATPGMERDVACGQVARWVTGCTGFTTNCIPSAFGTSRQQRCR